MGLGSALEIGKSALFANQTAIETTGNNLANIATRGYHKQVASLSPAGARKISGGIFVGQGVSIQQITRRIDTALEGRIRNAVSDEASSLARQNILQQIEALEDPFSDSSLSGLLNNFFAAWQSLTSSPTDNARRSMVVSQAQTLTEYINGFQKNLVDLQKRTDDDIVSSVSQANEILDRIEELNTQIVNAEAGQGGANSLRDERDIMLAELSQYLDISIVEQRSGAVDIFVGSNPIMLNGRSRGLDVRRQTVDNQLQIDIISVADQSVVDAQYGKIGSLITSRDEDVAHTIDTLNEFTQTLIYEVNKIHSQGQGQFSTGDASNRQTSLAGFKNITSEHGVFDIDAQNLALNSPDNGLTFKPQNGSFVINITAGDPPATSSHTINISLGNGAQPDTTLASLSSAIDSLTDSTGNNVINASITTDNRLQIDIIDSNAIITFANDTSGTLAALGINTFFSGNNANDIHVNSVVENDLSLLATGLDTERPGNGENSTKLSLLATRNIDSLGGLSLTDQWFRHVDTFAARLGQTTSQAQASTVVLESLAAQQQAVSGVSSDEEAINLMQYQRAYQGAARFLSVVDEMLQTLLSLA